LKELERGTETAQIKVLMSDAGYILLKKNKTKIRINHMQF